MLFSKVSLRILENLKNIKNESIKDRGYHIKKLKIFKFIFLSTDGVPSGQLFLFFNI